MRISFLLLFSLSVLVSSVSAQLPMESFDEGMRLLSGDDQPAAQRFIAGLERQYPAEASVLFLRGMYAFHSGDDNQAMMKFSEAIKADPTFAIAYGGRAEMFSQRGMRDRAVADISKAIELMPERGDFVRSRLGYAFQAGDFAAASADAERLIVLEPGYIINYYDAANARTALGDRTGARAYFEQAYASATPRLHTDVMYAKWMLNNDLAAEALPKVERALANDNGDLEGEDFQVFGLIYYKNKRLDEAVRYLKRAIKDNPNRVDFRNNLASVYIDTENWQMVKSTAAEALRINAQDPMANMLMAVGLTRSGDAAGGARYEAEAKRLEAAQQGG